LLTAHRSPPIRRPNHASRFEGILKMKLQAFRVSDPETLQSQLDQTARKRLSVSGLEVFHGRLLTLRWCTRNHGCHAFWIDVERQECERIIARVPPLVHKPERFIDQGSQTLCLCLSLNGVRPNTRDDVVQSCS